MNLDRTIKQLGIRTDDLIKVKRGSRDEYHTAWQLSDNREIDKQMYNIVINFGRNTKVFEHKVLWSKYFVFLYVSASRSVEPFLSNPAIHKTKDLDNKGEPITLYHVTRINAKHFTTEKKRKRQIITQTFRALNRYEESLFEYLLNGNIRVAIDFKDLFVNRKNRKKELIQFKKDLYLGKNKIINSLVAQISKRFSQMFKADISNGTIHLKNAGLRPHMLRHIRAYNLFASKDLPRAYVQSVVGWGDDMVGYYSDIKEFMREKEQIAILKGLGSGDRA